MFRQTFEDIIKPNILVLKTIYANKTIMFQFIKGRNVANSLQHKML